MFQSPQWGDNSKEESSKLSMRYMSSFSPRNGEIILKVTTATLSDPPLTMFQSPQWGDNSKGEDSLFEIWLYRFQSPQWGDNSKECVNGFLLHLWDGFSPRNGEIILKVDFKFVQFREV